MSGPRQDAGCLWLGTGWPERQGVAAPVTFDAVVNALRRLDEIRADVASKFDPGENRERPERLGALRGLWVSREFRLQMEGYDLTTAEIHLSPS